MNTELNQTPDEIARRLSFGIPPTEAVSHGEEAEKSAGEATESEAVSDLRRQLSEQRDFMQQQGQMMSYLVTTVQKLCDQSSPASAQKHGANTERSKSRERADEQTPAGYVNSADQQPSGEEEEEEAYLSGGKHQRQLAARQLLSLYRLQEVDPDLYSTTTSRMTTNAVQLNAWFTKMKPQDVKELLQGVQRRGTTAGGAITTYKQEVASTFTSKEGTKGAMLLDVLSSDKAHSRTAHVDALVRIAIECDDLRDMRSTTARIRAGGKYRGTKRAKGNIAESEGYARFDPTQSGSDTASRWWKALLALLEAYFGQQHASTAEQTAAEVNWRAERLPGKPKGTFKQLRVEAAEELIAREEILWTTRQQIENTDAPSTDKQRKLNLLAAAKGNIAKATLKRIGGNDQQLHTITYDQLADHMEQADDADRAIREISDLIDMDNSGSDDAAKPRAPKKKGKKELCWHHQHVGPCRFGDDCRNEHVGEAGALRHKHEDEDGICRDFKEDNCERGAECKFGHDKVTAAAAQASGQWTSREKGACRRYCKENMKRMTSDTLKEVTDSKLGVDGWYGKIGTPLTVQQNQWWADNMNADTNTTQTAAASAAQLYYISGETESDEQMTPAELLSDTDDEY